MRYRRLSALFAAVLGVLPSLAVSAAELDPRALFMGKLFVRTCMQHIEQPTSLVDELLAGGASELPQSKVSYFLGQEKGRVWLIPNPIGNFAVGLREDNLCMVFARRIETEDAEDAFSMLVKRPPTPLEAVQLSDERNRSAEGKMRTQVWSWRAEGAPQGLIFTLTTASENAKMQAMVSLARMP